MNTAVDLEIYYPTTLSSQKTIAQCVYNQDVADHIIFKSIGSGYMSRYIDSGHYIECAYFATTPTFVLTHCSVNDPDIVLHYNTGSSMYFTAERGYDLPSTISVSNVASNMRTWYPNTGYLNIQSGAVTQSVTITVTATINTEGKALQFIASNMHMSDYTTEKGWCKDNTHNYYSIAKTAFNSLEKATRKFIMEDDTSDIVAAKERLIAWAAANGEEITYESGSSDYVIHQASRYVAPYNNPAENSAVWIIAAVVIASSLAMAGLLIIKTRKK